MLDQLIIGTKKSLDDFGASLAEREIGTPPKKEIKETVPFSNLTYDFSKIDGEIYYEERELKYVFEMIADTPEELEDMKTEFSTWVMNVMDESIFDPYIPNYHFVGTYADIKYSDDDWMIKTTATVKFDAYPYKIANDITEYAVAVAAGDEEEITITNKSSHRLTPTVNTNTAVTVIIGNVSYAVGAGETTDDALKVAASETVVTVKNATSTAATVTFSFYEEVF